MGIEVELSEILSHVTWSSIVLVTLGAVFGIVVGALPGLTGSMAIVIALPFTLHLGPLAALGLLVGIYKGAMFGGAISAVAFGIPGTPSSTPTVFDGFPLSQQGYPVKALEGAHYSGVAADVISDLVLIFSFVPMAAVALEFTPRELTGLLLVALALIAVFSAESRGKGIIALGIGVLLGTVGPDPVGGTGRLHFGILELRGGLTLLPMLIGLFAVSQLMIQYAEIHRGRLQSLTEEGRTAGVRLRKRREDDHLSVREWLSCWRETLLGAAIGTLVGAIPGPGSAVASFSSYGIASGWKQNRSVFGKGSLRGVAAAESADSATAGATFIPLFAIGVPGSVIAAIFAVALNLQGIVPGPGMLQRSGSLVYAFFLLLMIASLAMVITGKPLIRFYALLSRIPNEALVPMLLVLTILGIFSISNSFFEVVIMLIFGAVGVLLRRHNIPVGAVILAFMVAPLLEANVRRGSLLSRGSWTYWFETPLAIGLFLAAIVTLFFLSRRRESGDGTTEIEEEVERVQAETVSDPGKYE